MESKTLAKSPAAPAASEECAALLTLLDMAMKNSVEKMSAMLKLPILMEGLAIEEASSTDWSAAHLPRECRAVVLGIRGEVHGNLVMLLTREASNSLNQMAPEDYKLYLPEEEERERALLEELANLLASTYLDVFSDVCGLRLLPTPPEFLAGPGTDLLAKFHGPDPQEASILLAYLVLKTPETRMIVGARLQAEATHTLVKSARQHMPELFLT